MRPRWPSCLRGPRLGLPKGAPMHEPDWQPPNTPSALCCCSPSAAPRRALLGTGTQSCSLAPNSHSLRWQGQGMCPRPGLSSVPREQMEPPVRLTSTHCCISLLLPWPASGPVSQEAEGLRRARMGEGEGREKRSKPKGEAS